MKWFWISSPISTYPTMFHITSTHRHQKSFWVTLCSVLLLTACASICILNLVSNCQKNIDFNSVQQVYWLITVWQQRFSVAGPRAWNSRPMHFRSAQSLLTFRNLHLFQCVFLWLLFAFQHVRRLWSIFCVFRRKFVIFTLHYSGTKCFGIYFV